MQNIIEIDQNFLTGRTYSSDVKDYEQDHSPLLSTALVKTLSSAPDLCKTLSLLLNTWYTYLKFYLLSSRAVIILFLSKLSYF